MSRGLPIDVQSYEAGLRDAMGWMRTHLGPPVSSVRQTLQRDLEEMILRARLAQAYPELSDIRQESYRAAWDAYEALMASPTVDHQGLIEDPSLTMELAYPDTYEMIEVSLILFEQGILRTREASHV